MSPPPSVEETYRARHAERDAARADEARTYDLVGNIRLALVIVVIGLVILPLQTRNSWSWWALIPVGGVFLVLGWWHDRVSKRLRRMTAATAYYYRELQRLDELWRDFADDGAALAPDADAELDYAQRAADLDLFGPASLFQLVNRAVTDHGRSTLARWLSEPADVPTVEVRQAAVRELAGGLDTREALAVAAAGDTELPLRVERLLEWAENVVPMPAGGLLRVLGLLLPPFLIVSIVLAFLGQPYPLVVALVLHVGTLFATRSMVGDRAARISTPDRALSRYAELIDAIEAADWQAPALKAIDEQLSVEGAAASDCLRSLHRLVEMLDARLNMFFSLTLGPILLWDLNLVLRAQQWQLTVGKNLRGWFQTIGEVEALASLGAFSAARPDYAFPELVNESGVFVAEKLAHPLIDRHNVVGNDITLGGPGSVLLLSGSNMSGKSTFLRALGINWALARAGGPVAAQSLRLSVSELVTSIRVIDSLARGTSHFYAELERIKFALGQAEAHEGRVLYLLDEMLHGTNSRERYIGAASVIRWLSAKKATGVVTTHDLALAHVKAELADGYLSNKHFGDEVHDGKIAFDYSLEDGPVESTNAIRLMRAIGIDIELTAQEP